MSLSDKLIKFIFYNILDIQHNKDCMGRQTVRFWLETHKSICTILRLVFVRRVKHYIIASNFWTDTGRSSLAYLFVYRIFINHLISYHIFRRQTFSSKHRSIVDLIEDAMKKSKENVFCYVKQSSQLIPPFPVRLTNPISHFGDISSLQNMCRLVIQKSVDIGKMDLLPLPNKLIQYCKEWETIYGEMPMRIG